MGLIDRVRKKNSKSKQSDKKDGLDFMTDADRVYYAVQEQGEISLSELADKLNIPISEAEGWAAMLDEQCAIELHYPIIGGAVLKKIADKKVVDAQGLDKRVKLIIFTVAIAVIVALTLYILTKRGILQYG